MVTRLTVIDLKRKLLQEVRHFLRRDGSVWKQPIHEVLHNLRQSQVRAVIFGGTLRSLLVSRLYGGLPGRPRDVDLVISGATLSQLEDHFRHILARRTRFGGLKLQSGPWLFDVWPVSDTWAFKQDLHLGPADFATLPSTTPLNVEAVAVEAWSPNRRKRIIYSGNDQFFDGILTQTIELNRPDTSFPELTVVRALIMASELQFRIGPRLARYICDVGASMHEEVAARIQSSHYGWIRIDTRQLFELIAMVVRNTSKGRVCRLPAIGQLPLWPRRRLEIVDERPPLLRARLGKDVPRPGLVGRCAADTGARNFVLSLSAPSDPAPALRVTHPARGGTAGS